MPPADRFAPPQEPPKPNWFYRIRVTLLLIVLGGVLAYAYVDRNQRESRRSWERTLRVAVILVEQAPLDPSAVPSLALRIDPLENQLEAEMRRYLPAGPKPFEIALLGPIVSKGAPPTPPDGEDLVAVAKYQWALRQWVNGIDEAGKLPTRGFDSRVYLVARPPTDARRKQVEGTSEAGGRVGINHADAIQLGVGYRQKRYAGRMAAPRERVSCARQPVIFGGVRARARWRRARRATSTA